MKLSVVIPVHDRHEPLKNTLAALGNQTLDADLFEVLVVDDGSNATSAPRIAALVGESGHRLIRKEQGGLASARNAGARVARGEILHFLDDDVTPAPETLEQHLASHAGEPGSVAVVGSLPYPSHVKLDSFLWYMERSGHYDLYKYAARKYPGGVPPMPPMNGNSSIPRELFFEVGAYDETYRQYGSEDLELGYRLARANVRFIYNPRAIGYHDHIKDFPRFCDDMETAGDSLIRLYRKYPEIKASKKIDLVEDSLSELPRDKKLAKIVMETTLRVPALLAMPRLALRVIGPIYALRHLAFPCYRWIGHYHYALGMRRALARGGR